MRIIIFGLFSVLLITLSNYALAQRHSKTVVVNEHVLQLTEWSERSLSPSASSVILLSGPTDNWNSDSAWFTRLAPKLARHFRVLTIDRAGQVLDSANAPVGYAQFGRDLAALLPRLNLGKTHIIAFASSNLAVNHLFAETRKLSIASLILIDPDVLLDYSISRYKKDARPFKDNLDTYLNYIAEGKYNARAKEKNTLELDHLQSLAGNDPETDWAYVETLFGQRLTQNNLQNTIREIAIYDQDLDSAASKPLPANIPLVVIDTDFEQAYIEKTESAEEKSGLIRWQSEAKTYYQQLVKRADKGKYIPLATLEHLLPFSDPELLIELIQSADQ